MNACRQNPPPAGGEKTSDYYTTIKLPARFENPSWFCCYGSQKEPPTHPFYNTSNGNYGWFAPNIHTVPHAFFPKTSTFSRQQGVGGMYKNFSLNTALDTSIL
ncbi:hypothetical protein R5R35_008500 [Gryllus longicercus]|uniref:Uncharacterized protein n=1 Tax=Gryllus longicercus TaxID=2509291 RepID=A0AAN9VED4_9ORTH|nr:Uncharacterized protein GBIM_12252 [Gryllus bimaculatus]